MNSKGVFQSVEFSTLVEQGYKSHFLTLPTMGLFEQSQMLGGGTMYLLCMFHFCYAHETLRDEAT